MLQPRQSQAGQGLGGGLSTSKNPFSVRSDQSPNCMNINFPVGGYIEKRLGSTTLNSTILVSSAATGFVPDSGGTLSTGLQVYFKLEETFGTRLDSYGTNNLSDNNNTSFAAGIIGNAANFVSANSNYLSALDASVFRATSSFTVGGWVYLTTTGGDQFLCSKWGGTTNEYGLRYEGADVGLNRFRFDIANSSGTMGTVWAGSFGVAQTSTWYLVLAQFDSATALFGISVNGGAFQNSSTTLVVTGSDSTFNLGARNGVAATFLNARLDEVGIWNKLLSAQERTDLYNAGVGNTYNKGASNSGFGAFDFGAGFVNGVPLRWLAIAAGTGIYASSNRGVTFVNIATDRGANYQYFERSKSYLIATSETGNKVLYWAGSVGTFMSALAPGSAPPAKHALSFQGYLLLMNDSGGNRRVSYAEEPSILTDAWLSSFELPSSQDDEITGGIILNKKAYVSTRYKIFRVSFVGGNPFFSYQEVRNWGWVPGTQKKITLQGVGETICALSWDKKLRIFDGSEDQIISEVVEQDNGICPFALSKINTVSLDQSRAEVDVTEQVYKLLVAITPSTQVTSLLNFNFRTGAFYPYDNQRFNVMVMATSGNSWDLLGVSRNGFVHWINSGFTDIGVAINAYYEGPYEFSQLPRTISKQQKLDLYFAPTSSGTIYIDDRTDFTTVFRRRDNFLLGNTSGVVQFMKTVDLPVTQNVYQFRIHDSASTAQPWRLTRVDRQFGEMGIGKA